MDRMIYVAMSGAKAVTSRQDTIAHNLANINTTGFRAQLAAFRSAPQQGPGLPTRAYSVETTPAIDLSPGVIQQTGRALDVAVNGRGMIAVQDNTGQEAYTRDGHFSVNNEGVLVSATGRIVLGDGGPISIPPDHDILIAKDGTVSAVPLTGGRANAQSVGRIKLVALPEDDPSVQLVRGEDGLFRTVNGDALPLNETQELATGALEGSNVNAVEMLVNMISVSRQFEMQMKLLQHAEANERSAAQLLSTSG